MIIQWISARRGSFEFDPTDLPIEICQLVGQLDQTQNTSGTPSLSSPLILLCCFMLLNYVVKYFPVLFTKKKLQRSSLNTVWDSSYYIIRTVFEVFDIYNLNHPRFFTVTLDKRFGCV